MLSRLSTFKIITISGLINASQNPLLVCYLLFLLPPISVFICEILLPMNFQH